MQSYQGAQALAAQRQVLGRYGLQAGGLHGTRAQHQLARARIEHLPHSTGESYSSVLASSAAPVTPAFLYSPMPSRLSWDALALALHCCNLPTLEGRSQDPALSDIPAGRRAPAMQPEYKQACSAKNGARVMETSSAP